MHNRENHLAKKSVIMAIKYCDENMPFVPDAARAVRNARAHEKHIISPATCKAAREAVWETIRGGRALQEN